nr:hypothetical protein Iba_chr09cCG11360 [Ipomoea batatas]GMD39361.1 hypothetical protein Iba_chr09fCG12850 [Ipomoea batatas]
MEKTQKNVLFGIVILLVCSSIFSCDASRFNVVKDDNLGAFRFNVDLACSSWRDCVTFCGDKGAYCAFGQCECGRFVPRGPRI